MDRSQELDRLKIEKQVAFERQRAAYDEYKAARDKTDQAYDKMDEAWKGLEKARERQNEEFEKRDRAFKAKDEVWAKYQEARNELNARIDVLRAESDAEHAEMQECFRLANEAYESGNKDDAPVWSNKGYEHQGRRNALNLEVKDLVQKIRAAREHAKKEAPEVDSTAFYEAKEEFEQAKELHEEARTEFRSQKEKRDLLKIEFDQLKLEFETIKSVYQETLEEMKADKQREREEILNQAGVIGQAREGAKIVKKDDGTIQVYHSGIGGADGYGHGHIALDETGQIIYEREAFGMHGSQNFKDEVE